MGLNRRHVCRSWQIAAQIEVMNRDYADAGIRWTLAKTTRIVNEDWFEGAGPGTFVDRHFQRRDPCELMFFLVHNKQT